MQLFTLSQMADIINRVSPSLYPEKCLDTLRAVHKLDCIRESDNSGSRGVATTGAARFKLKEMCAARLTLVGSDMGLSGKRLFEFSERFRSRSALLEGFGPDADCDFSLEGAIASLSENENPRSIWMLQLIQWCENGTAKMNTRWFRNNISGVSAPKPFQTEDFDPEVVVQSVTQISVNNLLLPIIIEAQGISEIMEAPK